MRGDFYNIRVHDGLLGFSNVPRLRRSSGIREGSNGFLPDYGTVKLFTDCSRQHYSFCSDAQRLGQHLSGLEFGIYDSMQAEVNFHGVKLHCTNKQPA